MPKLAHVGAVGEKGGRLDLPFARVACAVTRSMPEIARKPGIGTVPTRLSTGGSGRGEGDERGGDRHGALAHHRRVPSGKVTMFDLRPHPLLADEYNHLFTSWEPEWREGVRLNGSTC